MAKKQFTITTTHEVPEVIDTLVKIYDEIGGSFSGDVEAGRFLAPTPVGRVQGEYTISGQDITITIVKKPFVLPMRAIEELCKKGLRPDAGTA